MPNPLSNLHAEDTQELWGALQYDAHQALAALDHVPAAPPVVAPTPDPVPVRPTLWYPNLY